MVQNNAIFRQEFKKNFSNAQIDATKYEVFEDRVNAEKNDNLPHNTFLISNQNATCTLHVFLDNFSDQDTPDAIIFPNQQAFLSHEEGTTYTHLFIKNTHAVTDVLINEVKVSIGTVKRQTGI